MLKWISQSSAWISCCSFFARLRVIGPSMTWAGVGVGETWVGVAWLGACDILLGGVVISQHILTSSLVFMHLWFHSCGTRWWLQLWISYHYWLLSLPRRLWICWLVRGFGNCVRPQSRWYLWGGFGLIPQWSAKSHPSGLLMSLSYLTCGYILVVPICWARFVKHLLAAKPPNVGRHNGD